MLLGPVAVVGILAVIAVVGPGRVIHWLVSFLMPLAVVPLVMVGPISLLAREGGDLRQQGRPAPGEPQSTLPRRGALQFALVYD
jgi:hypothetical protein